MSSNTNINKLKHLKRSSFFKDTVLSPMEGHHACPKCPKLLGSKEAFELHLMVHERVDNSHHQEVGCALEQHHINSSSNMLLQRHNKLGGLGRSTISSKNDDASLTIT